MRKLIILAAVIALALGLLLGIDSLTPASKADDATHSTSLGIVPDYTGDNVDFVVAQFSTSDTNDARAQVRMVWYDYQGQAETEVYSTDHLRDSHETGTITVEGAIGVSLVPSTHVKAYFEAFNAAGALNWQYTRTISTP